MIRAAALALAVAGCAGSGCPPGYVPATVAELHVGLDRRGALPDVTPAEWDAWLAEDVTPRFPAGLTAWDAAGQWRAPNGVVTRQPAKVLRLVLPGADRTTAATLVAPMVAAAKTRLGQQSVLVVLAPACAGL